MMEFFQIHFNNFVNLILVMIIWYTFVIAWFRGIMVKECNMLFGDEECLIPHFRGIPIPLKIERNESHSPLLSK